MSIPVSSSVQESTTMQHNLKLHPDSQGNATARESGIETTEMQEDSPFVAKKRKRTSKVWDNFKEVTLPNGIVKAECIHCKHKLALNKSSTTTHLSRHLANCSTKKINDNGKGQQRDASYTSLPSEDEWKKVQVVCDFLEEFHKVTELISGSEYPTANLIMTELVLIKKLLKEDNKSHDPFMQEMRKAMQFKFDKYWGSCNLLFSIAAVLDPRNKMKVIAWCAKNTCSEADGIALKIRIRDTLQNLYNEYVEAHKTNIVENICDLDPQIECSVSVSMPKGRRNFESFIDDVDVVCDNTELELYFEEPVVKWKESTPFDAICWWKMNNSKFKILSRMACDVLSVPITTIASESAFSAGGRVIDPHRASLGVDTVQMLLCAGDWLRARYGIKGKAKDNDSSTKDIELA